MAEPGNVTDTQALLQSMLQRLRLQQPERSIIPKQDQEHSQFTEHDDTMVASSTEKSTYPFGNSLYCKEQDSTPSIWTDMDMPRIVQSGLNDATKDTKIQNSRIPSPKVKPLTRWSMNNHSTPERKSNVNSEAPKFNRKQVKLSLHLTENSLDAPDRSAQLPASEAKGQNGISRDVGGAKGDTITVPEKTTQTRTSRRKWGDWRQKRWTEKVKERWKERRKQNGEERNIRESGKQEETENSNCPDLSLTNESGTTTARNENVDAHHQSINSVADEALPASFDQMSDTLFSFGSFNLMEEIFTGEEWAKFLTPSQPVSSGNTQTPDSASSVSQACKEDRPAIGQWDFKNEIDSIFKEPPSRTSTEGFLQSMDTTEPLSNLKETPDFTMAWTQTFGFPKGQCEDSGKTQFQNMDLSVTHMRDNRGTEDQSMGLNLNNHSKGTEEILLQTPTSDQHLSPSHMSDPNHVQPETGKAEFLPLLDLTYLQPKNGSSLEKQGSLGRKRGHYTVTRSSSQLGKTESVEVNESRETLDSPCFMPVTALSPSSSISSLQNLIFQDYESSESTETAVKKRRVESTRRVRFAEEVIFLPAPVWSEDEYAEDDGNDLHDDDDDDVDDSFDDDGDDDDDDDDDDDNEAREDKEGEVDCREPSSLLRSSAPRWFVALKSRAKKKSRVKLPQISSPTIRSKTSKKYFFGNSTS